MTNIYIVELSQGKYYIGNFNGDDRFLWLEKYKPIKILEIMENCDEYDYDKYTRMYMDKYGIENVRGGSYIDVELDESIVKHLKLSGKMMNNNRPNDRCLYCKLPGHPSRHCVQKYKLSDCSKCGRNGHVIGWCCEIEDIDGNSLHKINDDNNILQKIHKNSLDNEENSDNNILQKIDETNDNEENIDMNSFSKFPIKFCTYCYLSESHTKENCPIGNLEYNNECSRCNKLGHYRLFCNEIYDSKNVFIGDFCVIF